MVHECSEFSRSGSRAKKPSKLFSVIGAFLPTFALQRSQYEILFVGFPSGKSSGFVFTPAADVGESRPAEREMLFMTPSQVRRFLDAASSNQNYALFALALSSGARQG